MWDEVDRYVNSCHMFTQTDQIVLGLSGGADSVCLARYLLYVRDRGGPELAAVHVNHLLRGPEAERDQEFAETFCRKWDIPLYVFRKDVRRISMRDKEGLEEAGRKVRYACFKEVMDSLRQKRGGKDGVRLAVAHHADDLAETMLFRMIRGTGPEGLIAIRPVNGDVIRPFLFMTKEKICRIMEKLGQDCILDSSNLEHDYSRNYIRHHILADMKKLNPRAAEHLAGLSVQLSGLLEYTGPGIERLCRDHILSDPETGEIWIPTAELLDFPDYARQEVARRLLFLAAGQEKDIGSVHVGQILELTGKQEGKSISLPYGVTAVRRGEDLVLMKEPPREDHFSFCQTICLPEFSEGMEWRIPAGEETVLTMRFTSFRGQQIPKSDCEKCFDYDTIKYQLQVRTRLAGDYFVLDSKGRHKRLSRYFIDNKIPKEERDRQLLLAEGSHIIWILGGRISQAYKVTAATKRLLVVLLQKR